MEPFKNFLSYEAAKKIAKALKRAKPQFSENKYLKNLKNELEPLELKARMRLLSDRLEHQWKGPNKKTILLLPHALKQDEEDQLGLHGFLVWPLTDFVARNGLSDFSSSMTVLKEMTKVFTAEFAVRPFFLKDEKWMLKKFTDWAQDPNEHVRRLVSEGSRPYLPWGQRLPRFAENPELTWPLLQLLKNDPSKYVQKSVANHMNDLSKDNGDWLVKKLKNWSNPWIIRHATRTLVKQGHPGALRLHGVSTDHPPVFTWKLQKNKVRVGGDLEVEILVHNKITTTQKIILDVEILFLKSKGNHSPKVFKGKVLTLGGGTKEKIHIRLPIRPVTTRTYQLGTQACRLVVNGHRSPIKKFQLE